MLVMPGEKKAVLAAIKIGEDYGYGNIIAHLKRQWIRKLTNGGLSDKAAKLAVDIEAYTSDFLGVDRS